LTVDARERAVRVLDFVLVDVRAIEAERECAALPRRQTPLEVHVDAANVGLPEVQVGLLDVDDLTGASRAGRVRRRALNEPRERRLVGQQERGRDAENNRVIEMNIPVV